MNKLAIAYRLHGDSTKKRDKAKRLLVSLLAAAKGLDLQFYCVLDRCPVDYYDMVDEVLGEIPHSYFMSEPGNGPTFETQMFVLLRQDHSDLVYFAEDDYEYASDAMTKAVDFLKTHAEADAVSLSNFVEEKYWVNSIVKKLVVHNDITWKQRPSSTLSFLIRQSALKDAEEVFKTYKYGNSDLAMWLSLTKFRVLNPWSLIMGLFDGRFILGSIILAWLFCRKQIMYGKKVKLYTPEETLATHLND